MAGKLQLGSQRKWTKSQSDEITWKHPTPAASATATPLRYSLRPASRLSLFYSCLKNFCGDSDWLYGRFPNYRWSMGLPVFYALNSLGILLSRAIKKYVHVIRVHLVFSPYLNYHSGTDQKKLDWLHFVADSQAVQSHDPMWYSELGYLLNCFKEEDLNMQSKLIELFN